MIHRWLTSLMMEGLMLFFIFIIIATIIAVITKGAGLL